MGPANFYTFGTSIANAQSSATKLAPEWGEFYKIDPLLLLSSGASHLFENNNDASFRKINSVQGIDIDLTKKMLQLMEIVLQLDERIITMKENKEI
jgi:hypothetical protein